MKFCKGIFQNGLPDITKEFIMKKPYLYQLKQCRIWSGGRVVHYPEFH